MRKTFHISRYIILVILYFHSVSLLAQKDLDSILAASRSIVYTDPNEAIEAGTEVLDKANNAETKVQAYMLISTAYLAKREHNKSMEYSLKAYGLLKDVKNIRNRVNVLNSISTQYQQLRIYDKAITYLDEALAMGERANHGDSLASVIGYNHAIRGFIYRDQMSCEIALPYFERAIQNFIKAGSRKTMFANISTLLYNKGQCFLQTMQVDSARSNFKLAIEYAEKAEANSILAFAKKGYSEVLTSEGHYEQALQELTEAKKLSENTGDIALYQEIYRSLSENYLAEGNFELYQHYFDRYLASQKETISKERETINNSIQNFISENKSSTEKQIQKLQKFQWGAYVFILIVAVFIINRILRARKTYHQIKKELKNTSL